MVESKHSIKEKWEKREEEEEKEREKEEKMLYLQSYMFINNGNTQQTIF